MKSFSFNIIFTLLVTLTLVITKPLNKRSGKGMHVQGSKLFDGNGNEFVFRGINIAHAWFTDKTEFSIKEIAALGANSARIVLACGAQYTKTSREEVEKIIGWCENAGLVCVLEVHDFTGSDNPSDITTTTMNYWKEMKDLVNAHTDYIIVNIANEWQGSWNKGSLWGDTYVSAVKSMRNMGIQNAIMIDASGYGQEIGPVIDDSQKVLAADPDKNVLFSYHVYSALGKDDKTLYAGFDGLKAKGVCWIVGEFGWWQNGGDVVYKTIMNYCNANSIGWLAWSWSGNSGIDTCLDLTSPKTYSRNDLTEWGTYVFNSADGIKKTSRMAYSGSSLSKTTPSSTSSTNVDSDSSFVVSNNSMNNNSLSDNSYSYCSSCIATSTGSDGSLWGWDKDHSCKIDSKKCGKNSDVSTTNSNTYSNNSSSSSSNSSFSSSSSNNSYCSSCNATSTGSDGSLWGWENDHSCKIDSNKCNSNSKSSKAPNGFSYCNSCKTTFTGNDGTRWGWENNRSCVINNSKC